MEPTATQKLTYEDGRDALDMLVEAGLTPDDVKKMCDSSGNALAGKALAVVRGGYEGINERFARYIMGDNFFGREEWSDPSTYGVSFTSKQSRIADKFPWSEALLGSECPFNPGKAISETHFAFLGMDKLGGQPLTIMGWQQVHPAGEKPRLYSYGSDCWYLNEEFATEPTCEFRWYLALKEVVPGSPKTSWDDMQGMIPCEYYVPSPVVELTKDFLYYQKSKVYPNIGHFAATDSLGSYGRRVVVGSCNDEAVHVPYWGGDAYAYVGLGLFRK